MTPVSIRAMALHCSLGADRAACVQAVKNQTPPPPLHLVLPGITDADRVCFHALHGTEYPFANARIEASLQPVLQAVLREAEWTAEACESLPVFVGSSCFNVRMSEIAHQRGLAGDGQYTYPMPYPGLGHIAQLIRETVGSRGPDFSFNTACSSAANALLAAMRYLNAGLASHALVVGAELTNLTSLAGFSSLQLLTDRVRSFGVDRDGTALGEGIGAILLEANADGPLRLLGGANQVDTYSVTTANPDGSSIASVLNQALRNSETDPGAIRAVKVHATGTPSNDEAEANGLRRVFHEMPAICALKPLMGHTLGACGVAELVLFASALQQGFIPAIPEDRFDPALGVEPLTQSVVAESGRYLLNHFGFGGNNTALVLECAC